MKVIDNTNTATASLSLEEVIEKYIEILNEVTVETRYRPGTGWTPSSIEEAAEVLLSNLDDSQSALDASHRLRAEWFDAHGFDVNDIEVSSEIEEAETHHAAELDESEWLEVWAALEEEGVDGVRPDWFDDELGSDTIEHRIPGRKRWFYERALEALSSLPAAPAASE